MHLEWNPSLCIPDAGGCREHTFKKALGDAGATQRQRGVQSTHGEVLSPYKIDGVGTGKNG